MSARLRRTVLFWNEEAGRERGEGESKLPGGGEEHLVWDVAFLG